MHGRGNYNWDECDYHPTRLGHLKTHKQAVHEGLKKFCDKCDHKATGFHYPKTHEQAIHEGVKSHCNKCDYEAT